MTRRVISGASWNSTWRRLLLSDRLCAGRARCTLTGGARTAVDLDSGLLCRRTGTGQRLKTHGMGGMECLSTEGLLHMRGSSTQGAGADPATPAHPRGGRDARRRRRGLCCALRAYKSPSQAQFQTPKKRSKQCLPGTLAQWRASSASRGPAREKNHPVWILAGCSRSFLVIRAQVVGRNKARGECDSERASGESDQGRPAAGEPDRA